MQRQRLFLLPYLAGIIMEINLPLMKSRLAERDLFEYELNDMLIRKDMKTQTRVVGVPADECIVSQKDLTYPLYAQECLSRDHTWFKI